MRRLLTATIVLIVAGTAQVAQAQTQMGLALDSTPDPLVLETITGETVDLGDVIGRRPVLLEFWATWCSKCEALHPKMEAAHAEFGDDVDFFGVAVAVNQTTRTVRRHLADHPLPFPMLWDANGAAVRMFMVPTTSYIVILDYDGRVAYTGVDTEQDIGGALRRIVEAGQSAPDS